MLSLKIQYSRIILHQSIRTFRISKILPDSTNVAESAMLTDLITPATRCEKVIKGYKYFTQLLETIQGSNVIVSSTIHARTARVTSQPSQYCREDAHLV